MSSAAVEHRTDPDRGLDAAEVGERVRAGLVNRLPDAPSRTFTEILRANVFTRFNALMTTLAVIVVAAGSPKDALFFGVVVSNTLIGTVQELRAKQSLDRLSVLSAPRAQVVRDGHAVELAIAEIVLDDVLDLRPGNQVPADGRRSWPQPRARRVAADRRSRPGGEAAGRRDPVRQLHRGRRRAGPGHQGRRRRLRRQAGRGGPQVHAGDVGAADVGGPDHQVGHLDDDPHRHRAPHQPAPDPTRLARGARLRHRRHRGDGARRPRAAHQRRLRRRRRAPGPPAHARAGAARHRGAGPRRRAVPRQDRHHHRGHDGGGRRARRRRRRRRPRRRAGRRGRLRSPTPTPRSGRWPTSTPMRPVGP